jgi:hypothetical protein
VASQVLFIRLAIRIWGRDGGFAKPPTTNFSKSVRRVGWCPSRTSATDSRSLCCLFGVMFIAFFMSAVFCSSLLWRLVAAPVAEVLKNQNALPPMLLATLPWEQALVIWFGIPLLFTLFVVYPVSLGWRAGEFSHRGLTKQQPLVQRRSMLPASRVVLWHGSVDHSDGLYGSSNNLQTCGRYRWVNVLDCWQRLRSELPSLCNCHLCCTGGIPDQDHLRLSDSVARLLKLWNKVLSAAVYKLGLADSGLFPVEGQSGNLGGECNIDHV